MAQTFDPKDESATEDSTTERPDNNQPKNREQEKQTDPNMTELRGFTDPSEKLEPEGTDNPDVNGMP
ncbi:MAG: hypothetical protein JWP69_519 [Flaviaesturariibacter sp.]|nr:hypothetical protein [Flaviaesturariibacter sp.]